MPRASGRRLAIRASLALALVACAPGQIDSAYWWRSPRFVAALQLSSAQASLIDEIYRNTLPERLKCTEQAEAARARLERLLDSDRPDDEVLEAAASESADADAARRSLRTKMLYRMWLVLTPVQRSQLAELAASHPTLSRHGDEV